MTRCTPRHPERKDISMHTLTHTPIRSKMSAPQQTNEIPESSPQRIHETQTVRILISKREIKDHAIRMGIATGTMPNMELLWRRQGEDGGSECFGRMPACIKSGCPWQNPCRQFLSYAYGRELGGRRVPSAESLKGMV
jgi:hypothetical protein